MYEVYVNRTCGGKRSFFRYLSIHMYKLVLNNLQMSSKNSWPLEVPLVYTLLSNDSKFPLNLLSHSLFLEENFPRKILQC